MTTAIKERIPLTPAQLDCARVIHELTEANGYPPTYREIAHEMDYASAAQAYRTVGELAKRGWVEMRRGVARSIALTAAPHMPDFGAWEFVPTPKGENALKEAAAG